MKQKYYLALTTAEWRLMIESLNNLRNQLISEGKYTDAVDEVLIKVANAKTKKFGDDEPEQEPIGIWGQRHLRYLKKCHRVRYANLLTSGELNAYLADIDQQAEDLFFRLVNQTAECEGVTEQLKADNQMEWIRRMNNIRNRAFEVVLADFIQG